MENQTLTITDLGSGMTRSDLINSLGVGSRLSDKAIVAARRLNNTTTTSTENDDDDSSSLSCGKEDDESYDDDTDIDSDDESCVQSAKNKIIIPCKAKDVGGFYSAFCALGTTVEIGTKVSVLDHEDLVFEFKSFSS